MTKIVWKDKFLELQEIAQMEAVFNERFFDELKKDENISFEGAVTEGILYLTLILKNSEETYYYPFETSIKSAENPKLELNAARLALFDFIGTYFEEFFKSNREVFVPIDWTLCHLGDVKLYARGQIVNKKLEKEADSILRCDGFNVDGNKDRED